MDTKKESKFSYNLNFLECINDGLFTVEEVKEHLENKFKVEGKTGNLGGKIELKINGNNLQLISTFKFRKSYLKYLSKKFLFKKNLTDWVHLVSDYKTGYDFTYYKVAKEGEVV
ncbi:60S ribosomal protein L22 [Cucumispora dikerogammari]|nr:60S ribosomal protein L22 [Cucumispora dikerogammari]